ncbi:MAG TPA: response regulator [Gallionellaceae bacterium]|nr:response regulator [Gallionellaceae bacterium]
MKLLLVEDDAILRDGLARSLQQSGYAVDSTANGLEANHILSVQDYDLLVLDLGLQARNGLEVLGKFRSHDKSTPVLIITARDSITDRVSGLDLGADDYLIKPFELAEFEARVRALLRRGMGAHSNQVAIGELRLDLNGRRAYLAEDALELSARELGVLEILMLRAGQVVNKEHLAEKMCSWGDEIGANAIEVYVHRLRKKLEHSGISIRTIRGLGYLMEK